MICVKNGALLFAQPPQRKHSQFIACYTRIVASLSYVNLSQQSFTARWRIHLIELSNLSSLPDSRRVRANKFQIDGRPDDERSRSSRGQLAGVFVSYSLAWVLYFASLARVFSKTCPVYFWIRRGNLFRIRAKEFSSPMRNNLQTDWVRARIAHQLLMGNLLAA